MCLSPHRPVSSFPQKQGSRVITISRANDTHPHSSLLSFNLSPTYALFSLPLILKVDGLPSEIFSHGRLISFVSYATTSKRKQINSTFAKCLGKQSPSTLLWKSKGAPWGENDSPHRAQSTEQAGSPGTARRPSGQWLPPWLAGSSFQGRTSRGGHHSCRRTCRTSCCGQAVPRSSEVTRAHRRGLLQL